jgi:pimeloyl-ACP methyl ester carboxylesterase
VRDAVRGATRLGFDAVEAVTRVVEGMHANIAAASLPFGRGTDGRARGIAGLVYEIIRRVNAGVGAAVGFGLEWLPPVGVPIDPRAEALLAVLNGVVGDHLAATSNPLAIRMQLRGPAPRGRVLLLVHGLCASDYSWRFRGADHGEALAGALGVTPVYVLYNSGRSVCDNGRELAALLEAQLTSDAELTILGHSMGGLVARSACVAAREAGHAWLGRLRRLVCLGSPHAGAPLERGGRWLESALELSPYTAPLGGMGGLRSVGITDLRHGHVLGGEAPLPGVECHALAGGRDALVPVASALAFPGAAQWVCPDASHLGLLDHPAVYARLLALLS